MSDSLKKGDTVYNIYGQEGEFITVAPGGCLVFPIYEDDVEGPQRAAAETWGQVYAKPPEMKLHAEIQALQERITEARTELARISAEKAELDRSQKEAARLIKARPDLSDLHMWLAGEVTHIVALEYYSIRIGTVEEILREAGRDKELRLLSIAVDPKANRFWTRYASYSDGSGSQTRCLLATSFEHAQQRAAEYVAAEVARAHSQDHSSLVLSAHKQGVQVPAGLLEKALAKNETERQKRIDQAKAALARQQAELAALEAREAS